MQTSMMVSKCTVLAQTFVSFPSLTLFCNRQTTNCLSRYRHRCLPVALSLVLRNSNWMGSEHCPIISFSWSTGFRQRRAELNKTLLIQFALWSDSRTTERPRRKKLQHRKTAEAFVWPTDPHEGSLCSSCPGLLSYF